MGDDPLATRIERALGTPNLLDRLAKLPGSEFQSLLLAVHRRRAALLSARDVLRAYEANKFVQPSPIDPATLLELDRLALSLLPPDYEPLDLSPVCPFGGSAVLGAIHQNWVLAASRQTEVVSDPTIALALECAARRRALKQSGGGDGRRINLFATHRTIRSQLFSPPFRQHFSLIALCSAGRDAGGHRFDTETLIEHLTVYLDLTERTTAFHSTRTGLRVALTPLEGGVSAERLEEHVVQPLARRFPDVRFEFDHDRQNGKSGYYIRTCFKVWLATREEEANVADGGFTDWTQRLLSDRKERALTSGLGTEILAPFLTPR